MKNVLLLTGGSSPEHDVSVKSRNFILPLIDKNKFNVINVLIDKSKTWILADQNQVCHLINKNNVPTLLTEDGQMIEFDLVFPLVLGDAENGMLQGMFEALKVPYIGTGILGSAIGFDKIASKYFALANGVQCNDFGVYDGENYQHYSQLLNSAKLFIKPSNAGSTFGCKMVSNYDEFEEAILIAKQYDNRIIVEKYLANARELFCGVFYNGNTLIISEIGEALTSGKVFDYQLKYDHDLVKAPCDISKDLVEQIKDLSFKLFKILECKTFSRFDFFLHENELYFNEVNTIPAMTPTSIFLKLISASGYNQIDFLTLLFENPNKIF